MCPPAAVAAVSTAVSVGTSIYGGIQANKAAKDTAAAQIQQAAALERQAIATRQIAEINAREFEHQADLRIVKGESDSAAAFTRYQRQAGQTIASIGTTGLDISSFGDLLADSALESALEIEQIKWTAGEESRNLRFQAYSQRYNAELEAQGIRLQSSAAKTSAKASRVSGTNALIGSFAQATSTGSDFYEKYGRNISLSGGRITARA